MMPSGDALLASKTVVDGSQIAQLPVTQWRSEVARWFSISLIILQMGLLEGATGPLDPEMKPYWVLDKDPDLITSCQRQRFGNAADARNFNLSVLIALLVGGSVIITLGSTIDKLVGFAQRLVRPTARGRFYWVLDSLFQHQRLAYEAAGVRPWLDADTVVPVAYGQAPEANLRVVSQPRLFHRMDAVHGAPFLSDAKDFEGDSQALDPYCISQHTAIALESPFDKDEAQKSTTALTRLSVLVLATAAFGLATAAGNGKADLQERAILAALDMMDNSVTTITMAITTATTTTTVSVSGACATVTESSGSTSTSSSGSLTTETTTSTNTATSTLTGTVTSTFVGSSSVTTAVPIVPSSALTSSAVTSSTATRSHITTTVVSSSATSATVTPTSAVNGAANNKGNMIGGLVAGGAVALAMAMA
ncbi:hypothetical protein NEMBOFW57_006426 [Staphylotrichum longicolle]|uniref:Uncharacterized protein n=1 Tax=Staphylotrichum longicolle TaxID=669026 RepID=A0AAD4ET59_9PEZI|nr:hypothetical protein NEMBOFW57_006426 [Staphylotrichum longicolle]